MKIKSLYNNVHYFISQNKITEKLSELMFLQRCEENCQQLQNEIILKHCYTTSCV